MLRLDQNGDAAWRKMLVNRIGDLNRHRLLCLQATRKGVDEASQFRQAHDALTGIIGLN